MFKYLLDTPSIATILEDVLEIQTKKGNKKRFSFPEEKKKKFSGFIFLSNHPATSKLPAVRLIRKLLTLLNFDALYGRRKEKKRSRTADKECHGHTSSVTKK
jgi:hypothetical protein